MMEQHTAASDPKMLGAALPRPEQALNVEAHNLIGTVREVAVELVTRCRRDELDSVGVPSKGEVTVLQQRCLELQKAVDRLTDPVMLQLASCGWGLELKKAVIDLRAPVVNLNRGIDAALHDWGESAYGRYISNSLSAAWKPLAVFLAATRP